MMPSPATGSTQRKRPHAASGFTLIEVIAAVVLLGVLAAVLLGMVRGAERSTTAATEASERSEQYARTHAFLREHIGGALPMRWRREPGQPLKFAGGSSNVTYLAPVTSQIAEGGVLWWQLAASDRDGKKQLVLRRLAQDPEGKTVPDLAGAEQIALADHIAALSLAYFDPGDDPLNSPESGRWVDSWDESSRMATLIRMRVTETGGRAWPEFIIPLKLSQSLGCNFDYQKHRCLIPGVAER